jgi:hypothetical protein
VRVGRRARKGQEDGRREEVCVWVRGRETERERQRERDREERERERVWRVQQLTILTLSLHLRSLTKTKLTSPVVEKHGLSATVAVVAGAEPAAPVLHQVSAIQLAARVANEAI